MKKLSHEVRSGWFVVCFMSTFAWTIFLPRRCDHCEQIKTVTPETHGTFIGLTGFCFLVEEEIENNSNTTAMTALLRARPGAMLLLFRSSSQWPHWATAGQLRKQEAGRGGGAGWGPAVRKLPRRRRWPKPRARLKVFTTAPTISSNRRGWTAHSALPTPTQRLWTLGHSRLPWTHVHSLWLCTSGWKRSWP